MAQAPQFKNIRSGQRAAEALEKTNALNNLKEKTAIGFVPAFRRSPRATHHSAMSGQSLGIPKANWRSLAS
jgi:hypothetical protein